VLIIRVRHAIDTNLLPAVENPDRGGPHRRHALPLSPISCQRRGQSAMEYEELCFGVRGARPWTGHRGGQERGSSPPTAGGRVRAQRPPSLSHSRELVGDAAVDRRSPRVPLHKPTKKAWVVSIAESASFFMLQVYVSGVLEISKQCCKLFHFDAAKVDHDVVDVVFECCGCYFLMSRNSSSCCVCNMT
jgi:hypothetical protein